MRLSFLLLLLLCSPLHADPLRSPRLALLAKQLAAHAPGAEAAFWRQLATEGAPIVEDLHEPGHLLVSFAWRGNAATRRVQLRGPVDAPRREAELTRLPGSNVFTTSLSLPDDARFTYFFVIDGDATDGPQFDHFRHDPFNQHQYEPTSSILALPRAPAQPSLVPHRGVAAGQLWRHTVRAATPQQERQLFVYTPAGYTPTGSTYPLLVAFDAETATGPIPLSLILDELIAAKRIPPIVALFIGNVDRAQDLKANSAFSDYVALDLVPWMRAHYHATSDPRRTVISGISLGGLASAYAALRHPEVYGNVLSQSGSFWWGPPDAEPEVTARDFAKTPRLPLRFWLEVGLFEFGVPRLETTQLAANRHLRDVLQARGYDVTYQEFVGNHTFICWRGTIAHGLTALFGTLPKLAALRVPPVAPRPPVDISAATRASQSILIRTGLIDGGDAALAQAKRLLEAHGDGYVVDEDEINSAGCALLMLDHARESLPLLRWNTERFPESANTRDSLAWAYYEMGDRSHAIENFKVDVRLDPKNAIAAQILAELDAMP